MHRPTTRAFSDVRSSVTLRKFNTDNVLFNVQSMFTIPRLSQICFFGLSSFIRDPVKDHVLHSVVLSLWSSLERFSSSFVFHDVGGFEESIHSKGVMGDELLEIGRAALFIFVFSAPSMEPGPQ